MEQTKIISFAGIRRGDIPYYVAKLLSVFDEPVLCVDNAEVHDLYDSLKKEDGEEYVTFRNVTFACDIAYSEGLAEKFGYIVVYHGFEIDDDWWVASNTHFVMSNSDKYDMIAVRDSVKHAKHSNVYLILADMFYNKIKDKDVPVLLEIAEADIAGYAALPFEISDKVAYEAFTFGGLQRVADVSGSMKEVIKFVYEATCGEVKEKEFRKMVSKAR